MRNSLKYIFNKEVIHGKNSKDSQRRITMGKLRDIISGSIEQPGPSPPKPTSISLSLKFVINNKKAIKSKQFSKQIIIPHLTTADQQTIRKDVDLK